MAESAQYKTMKSCFAKLCTALKQDPVTMANELLSEGLIPSTVDVGHLDGQKLGDLLLKRVEVKSSEYYRIVGLLSKHEWQKPIVEALHKQHGELITNQELHERPMDEAVSLTKSLSSSAVCTSTSGLTASGYKHSNVSKRSRANTLPEVSADCAVETEEQEIERKIGEVLERKHRKQERILKDLQKSKDEFVEEMSFLEHRLQQMLQRNKKDSLQKWSAKVDGLNAAKLGETTTISLDLAEGGDEGGLTARNVKCDLVPLVSNTCSVASSGENKYKISYKPANLGHHKLHITVDGRHIKGSPFPVWVGRNFSCPTRDQILNKVKKPQGIAVSKNGRLIVVEYTGHRVTIFKPESTDSGTLTYHQQSQFGSKGPRHGEFNLPCGVAVDDDDNILVTDGLNDRIQKFTLNGVFIQSVEGQEHPIGIGIHPQSKRIYVTQQTTCSIQILNPDLSQLKRFGKKGKGRGEFNDPKDVAFDSNGDVYVADNENHRIQVFTADGEYLREFGNQIHTDGTYDGELSYPTSVCIDGDNIVYITELYNCRISIFTHEGTFLMTFGSEGNDPGQFQDPRGITMDANGVIYVSDHGNNRVQIFT